MRVELKNLEVEQIDSSTVEIKFDFRDVDDDVVNMSYQYSLNKGKTFHPMSLTSILPTLQSTVWVTKTINWLIGLDLGGEPRSSVLIKVSGNDGGEKAIGSLTAIQSDSDGLTGDGLLLGDSFTISEPLTSEDAPAPPNVNPLVYKRPVKKYRFHFGTIGKPYPADSTLVPIAYGDSDIAVGSLIRDAINTSTVPFTASGSGVDVVIEYSREISFDKRRYDGLIRNQLLITEEIVSSGLTLSPFGMTEGHLPYQKVEGYYSFV